MTTGTLALLLTRRTYRQPPSDFEATPDVASARARWLDYRAGREPLPAMDYFVLTLVWASAGGRNNTKNAAAAKVFQIDERVLPKISELTTARGAPTTARKAPPKGGRFQELTGAEQAWLEQAVRKAIKRLGERASGATLTLLTFSDLSRP